MTGSDPKAMMLSIDLESVDRGRFAQIEDPRFSPETDRRYWEWQEWAACRGMDTAVFFRRSDESHSDYNERLDTAKAVCGTCPVLQTCRDHALQLPEPYGVWGGLSEVERAKALGVRSVRYAVRYASSVRRDPMEGRSLNSVTDVR